MGKKYILTPVGWLLLTSREGFLTHIDFIAEEKESDSDEITEKAAIELIEYFEGKRKAFDVPLRASGTQFYQAVWEITRKIPYGSTLAYSEVAAMAANPRGARAVGAAMHANPIPIIIPCHRVIGKNKKLGGYGEGIEVKKMLLNLENIYQGE